MGLFEDEMKRIKETQELVSSIGLIPAMMQQKTHVVNYDPSSFTIKDMEKWMKDMMEYEDKLREHRIKTGWKPEYYLSMAEAIYMPLEWLQILGEKYNVYCSLEVGEIVKQREKEANDKERV